MKKRSFIQVWAIASVVMFLLSYLWHGVLLNDYVNIKYPIWLHLLMASIVYVVIGFILTYLHQYTTVHKLKYKGLVIGALLGFFIYLIAFVLGVSYNPHSMEHTVVDFIWQMAEQGFGGMTVGVALNFVADYEKLAKSDQ
jgi:hypothetical protein